MSEKPTMTATWVKIVLAASLTVNLLIVGLVGGAVWKGRQMGDTRPDAQGISVITRALPPRYQANVRRDIRDRMEEVRASRETMLNLRQDLAQALVAEPFDMAVVADIFVKQRTVLFELAGSGHDIVIDQIESMDANERAEYAENLLRDNPPRPPRDR